MIRKLFTKATLIRALSAVLLVIIAVFVLLMGGNTLLATVFVVSLIGQMELYRVLSVHGKLPGMLGYVASGAYYLLLLMQTQEYVMFLGIALLMLLMAAYVFLFPKYRTEEICLVYLGFFYVPVMMSFVYQIRELQNGICLVFLVFLSSWICDTCAYLVGVPLGKHKLAPKLSPNKSVEGSIGGVIGSVLLGALYGALLQEYLGVAFTSPVRDCAIVCGFGALISQVGDLAASGIKRNYEVKDYGNLIPGHGGILDRFDSVIFVAPAIYFLILLIG